MLTIIAIILFVLSFVGVDFDGHSLIALGLAFLAAGHVFDGRLPGLTARA